jgi:tetratricopeptide (TPR) repeat protein
MYSAKDYAGAARQLERAVALDPNNPEPLEALAEARFSQGQGAAAATTLTKALQLSTAAGRKPGEQVYKRAVGIAYESKSPSAVELGRQWVAAYPSKDSWKNSIAIYRNLNQPDVSGTLDLLRLLRAVGALDSGREYGLYANAAADVGQYAEAQQILNEGLAAKLVTQSDPLVRELTTGLRSKQKATAADLAAATRMATTPAALIRIGDGYYGLGDYAKAAETYRAAIAKGADANLANLHLGMALVRSGDRAGGIAALEKVGGARADIAKYWLIYARQPG